MSSVDVLVATHSYSGNGAAVMLLAAMEHWIRDLGWNVDVVFDPDKEFPPDLARIGVNPKTSVVLDSYDFALVNTLVSAGYLETLCSHVPTVLWVHEGYSVLWSSEQPANEWRRTFSRPERIIFQGPWQSEWTFRPFIAELPVGRVSCVPNGLPDLPAGLMPKAKPPGKKRIVYMGGVYGRKRPQDLVDAILAVNRDDVECVFVGSTELINTIGEDAIAKIKSRPDTFELAGELDRKSGLEYLLSADAFCLPSSDESQPIAPLEAALLHIPCLLTDLPPYVGTWKHGQNCLMNPVGDSSLLSWNLRAVLDDSAVRQRIVEGAGQLPARFTSRAFFQRFDAELPI